MTNSLINWFKAFNSKERFLLLGQVLGNKDFTLGDAFRDELDKALPVHITEDVFCAMDFHLDWLYAALRLASNNQEPPVYLNHPGHIKAQQEDIDLLIAFETEGKCHVILIEAKATTGWNNAQLESKASRLRDFFGDDGYKWKGIIPYFVLMSPGKPKKIDYSNWPQWMTPDQRVLYVPLRIQDSFKRVSRCNQAGNPCAQGSYWTVVNR